MREELLDLAERVAAFDAKLQALVCNRERLTAGSQTIAIAMLVALNLNIFGEAAASLRALAATKHPLAMGRGEVGKKRAGICRKCGGSGWLFRPVKERLLNFRRCHSCIGMRAPILLGKRGNGHD